MKISILNTWMLLILIFFTGCEMNTLYDADEISGSNQDETAVYNDPSKAQALVDQLYGMMNDFAGIRYNGYLSAYTDEAVDASAVSFNLGSWSSNNVPGFNDMWSGSYRAIRITNKFLENIPDMPLSDQFNFTENTRDYMINQARCIRAYFYSELIRCYGGVPIVTSTLHDYGDDVAGAPRQTLDSTVNFVVNELDSIVSLLPKNVGGTDYGRVTRGFALAIKSRLLLYMASPLFNGPGADETGNPYVCYGSNDPERWEKALEAAKDVIALGSYSLFTSTTINSGVSVFNNVFFLDRGHSSMFERIFSFQKAK
ncbi:MAG: RagB/SusD family nutrient uptake outer membrane protein, partial [Pigmentiphaga sp.]|nr:RagB/SusD family nutrient uptake outer membrane protein [Pigmentiphaga sp.]